MVMIAQSRRGSMIESVVNVAIGYIVAVASQVAIFPLFGIHIPLSDNLLIGLFFTVVSIVRSYALRRVFNRLSGRHYQCKKSIRQTFAQRLLYVFTQQNKGTDMNYEKTLENMRRYGGSFVQQLAILWFVADQGNRDKLEAAFSDIFDKYENI